MNFTFSQEHKRFKRDSSGEEEEEDSCEDELSMPRPGKKTRGRVKVKMEFIKSKNRRYTTFSKRKTGIMKKAHELATLTGLFKLGYFPFIYYNKSLTRYS